VGVLQHPLPFCLILCDLPRFRRSQFSLLRRGRTFRKFLLKWSFFSLPRITVFLIVYRVFCPLLVTGSCFTWEWKPLEGLFLLCILSVFRFRSRAPMAYPTFPLEPFCVCRSCPVFGRYRVISFLLIFFFPLMPALPPFSP